MTKVLSEIRATTLLFIIQKVSKAIITGGKWKNDGKVKKKREREGDVVVREQFDMVYLKQGN